MTRLLTVLVIVATVVLSVSCSRSKEPSSSDSNEAIMISLGRAHTLHLKADTMAKNGDIEQALAVVKQIEELPFPEGADEARDVRLDAKAKIAKLHLQAGDIGSAEAVIKEAIGDAKHESFFVANLHTVHGEIFEARAQQTDDANEQTELRRNAIESYDLSLQMNERVQAQLAGSKP